MTKGEREVRIPAHIPCKPPERRNRSDILNWNPFHCRRYVKPDSNLRLCLGRSPTTWKVVSSAVTIGQWPSSQRKTTLSRRCIPPSTPQLPPLSRVMAFIFSIHASHPPPITSSYPIPRNFYVHIPPSSLSRPFLPRRRRLVVPHLQREYLYQCSFARGLSCSRCGVILPYHPYLIRPFIQNYVQLLGFLICIGMVGRICRTIFSTRPALKNAQRGASH